MTFATRIKESNELAVLANIVSAIRIGKGQGNDEFLALVLNITKERLNEISSTIDQNPDMNDWDIAESLLFG